MKEINEGINEVDNIAAEALSQLEKVKLKNETPKKDN